MGKLKNLLKLFISIIIFGCSIVLAINIFIISETRHSFISLYDAKNLSDVDCVLVLGAGLKNGGPSDMLKERLDKAVSLYNDNNNLLLLMSGDHSKEYYDEVNVMKRYAVINHVPSSSIFMDHAGLSTYDSLKRAKDIFGAKKIIVVTQGYHLSRALYIASSLGLEAYGIDATEKVYPGQKSRDLREVLARTKDFFKSLFKPSASITGNIISLDGDGNKTNDNYVLITNNKTGSEVFTGSRDQVNNVFKLVSDGKYFEETCDGNPDYLMTVNGNKYYLEVYDDEIHIILNGKELVLDKGEAKVILNLIK